MNTIEVLTSHPTIDNVTALPEEGLVAYWWSEDGEPMLRLHDPSSNAIETVPVEKFDPDTYKPLLWTGDAFLASTRPETYLMDRDGSATEILPEDEYTLPHDVSPDGRYILYTHYREFAGDVWLLRLYDRRHETSQVLSENPEQWWHAGFSPDGQWLAYRENPANDFGHGRQVIATIGGEIKQAFTVADPESPTRQHSWHPDSERLFVDDRSTGIRRVGLCNWRTQETAWFGPGEYNEQPRVVTSDGTRIVVTRDRDGVDILLTYTIDGGSERKLELPEGTVGAAVRHQNDALVLTHEESTNPGRLFQYDLETDTTNVLLDTQTDALEDLGLVEAEHVAYESTDGLTVNAILYRADMTPSPAVVKVHGGPDTAQRRGFNPFAQFLAAEGYTVIEPNYRGSTDQDRDFEEALRGASGEKDVNDVAAACSWLADKEWIDDDRIVVYGYSYGAFLAAMATIRYPDLWEVAIAENGGFDRVEILSDPNPYAQRRILDDPKEIDEAYLRERSPVHRTGDIGCPIAIIQGSEDPGIKMAERFVEGLESRGWTKNEEFWFEVFEREGHAIRNKQRLWSLIAEILNENI